MKKSKLEIQEKAFSRIGVKLWNELPASLRELTGKKQFKKRLHTALTEILQSCDAYVDINRISTALRKRQF